MGGFAGNGNRFIPTPVGNIGSWKSAPGISAVHPHTRGEHLPYVFINEPMAGSSPHPWGTSQYTLIYRVASRFIPTPVGNISDPEFKDPVTAVHPHTRGEHLKISYNAAVVSGSSPHPWGTYVFYKLSIGRHRFIPTPVGNICFCFVRHCESPVHPHTRGEHTFWNTLLLLFFLNR